MGDEMSRNEALTFVVILLYHQYRFNFVNMDIYGYLLNRLQLYIIFCGVYFEIYGHLKITDRYLKIFNI